SFLKSIAEIVEQFFAGPTLGVHPRNLLDPANPPLALLLNDGRIACCHASTPIRHQGAPDAILVWQTGSSQRPQLLIFGALTSPPACRCCLSVRVFFLGGGWLVPPALVLRPENDAS